MKTNRVKHHNITDSIDGNCEQETFPAAMQEALNRIIAKAEKRYGATVDWTTLRIEPGEEIYAVTTSGERSVYQRPLQITVDAVLVETGYIQENKSLDMYAQVYEPEPGESL